MENQNLYAEQEIDLKQLLIAIMKKWRILLALVLIGVVAGAAIQLLPKEEERSKEDEDLIKEYEIAAQQRTVYEKEREYIANSYLMQLNAKKLYTGKVQYYIYDCKDADYVNAEFSAIMQDKTLREQLCELLGNADESELDYFASVNLSKIMQTSVIGGTQTEKCTKLNLYIQVTASTEECAQQMLAALKDAVDKQAETLNASSTFTIVQVSENLTFGNSDAIQSAQNTKLSVFNSAYEACSNLESQFSDEEYELYEEYYIEGDPSELPVELFKSNPLKIPVILGIIAFFLGCVWYVCCYLLSSKGISFDDFQHVFGLRVLAFINKEPAPKNFIDRWLNKMELSGYPESVTADYAAAVLGNEKTVVLFNGKDELSESLAQELASKNSHVACFNAIGSNTDALSAVRSGGSVVLLLRLNECRRLQLQQELSIVAQVGAQTAGIILVR